MGKYQFVLIGGYALAWREDGEIKVASALASNDVEKLKLVDEISEKKFPGFCLSSVLKVHTKDGWKFDSELSDDDSWEIYWDCQKEAIKSLLNIEERIECILKNLWIYISARL